MYRKEAKNMLQLANTTKCENNLYNMHKWIADMFWSKHSDKYSYFDGIGKVLFFASIQYAFEQGATSFADVLRICSTYFSIALDDPNLLLDTDEFRAQKGLLAILVLESENARGMALTYVWTMLENLAKEETQSLRDNPL